jgi:hypothetical protein
MIGTKFQTSISAMICCQDRPLLVYIPWGSVAIVVTFGPIVATFGPWFYRNLNSQTN